MVHRTMQGREIDMEKLSRQHELLPAIGNMKVNARGDELGPGGQIIRTRESIVAEYYEDPTDAPRATTAPIADNPAPVVETTPAKNKKTDEE